MPGGLHKRLFLPEELIVKVFTTQVRSVLLLGGPDTGKTTFTECLIELLRDNFTVGVVDCDMGQSHIGPPSTVAWARVKEEFSSWQDWGVENFCFIGSFSPAGNVPRVLQAAEYIHNQARQGCDKVVIDTTGYILGKEAVEFKRKKIAALKPDVILALQREDELGPILKDIEIGNCFLDILRVSPETGQKSNTQRSSFRNSALKRYFSQGREVWFTAAMLSRWDNLEEGLLDKLVSLRDVHDIDLGLGVIRKQEGGHVLVLTPFPRPEEASTLTVGNCKWDACT